MQCAQCVAEQCAALCGDGARMVSVWLDGGDGVGESDIYSELE